MTRRHWSHVLDDLGACMESREWARTQPSARAAWDACTNSHWLLWILAEWCEWSTRDRDLRLLACDFAERVVGRIADDGDRGIAEGAVEVARRFALGDASDEERAAARAAAMAAAMDAAARAAAMAAAARAAAMDAAARAAAMAAAARAAEDKAQCDLIRRWISFDVVAGLVTP